MDYPQHLCVVSQDRDFHHQITSHFGSSAMSLQWFDGLERLLASGLPHGACLLIDADLASGVVKRLARTAGLSLRNVTDFLINRPFLAVIALCDPDQGRQANANPLLDVLIKRADVRLAKPVAIDHLAFTLQNIRRSQTGSPAVPIQADGMEWRFDPIAMQLQPPVGRGFALSASEARLIAMLITKDPEPVRREDLIELFRIKSPNIRRIDTTVYRLRHKIEQLTGFPAPFSTVHGVGYRNNGLSATVPLSF